MTYVLSDDLVLFTSTYPSVDGEVSFLQPEIPHLLSHFRRIVIVPELATPPYARLPERAELDLSYAECLPLQSWREALAWALNSQETYREILGDPLVLMNPQRLTQLISLVARAEKTRLWALAFLRRQPNPPRTTVLYTYWLDHSTLGLGLVRRSIANTRLVSRAHNYDLYESATRPRFSCRRRTLDLADRVYVVSDHGRRHLLARFPEASGVVEISRLGVPDSGVSVAGSDDGVFRIVSCSRIVPVKRLGLLAQGLIRLARQQPKAAFKWSHFGGSVLDARLTSRLATAPRNLHCDFKGWRPNEDVLRHYQDVPADLFINVSSSEGVPVAIMEAQSCGLQVLATAVGGVPEIVSPASGFLLPPNPSAEHISDAAWDLLTRPGRDARGKAARERWRTLYDAEENYRSFARRLENLCLTTSVDRL